MEHVENSRIEEEAEKAPAVSWGLSVDKKARTVTIGNEYGDFKTIEASEEMLKMDVIDLYEMLVVGASNAIELTRKEKNAATTHRRPGKPKVVVTV